MGKLESVFVHIRAVYWPNHCRLQVPHLGFDAAREAAKKKVKDIQFNPKQTDLDQPKEGEHDDKEHSGGNKWAGGVSLFFLISSRCCTS
jgi:phosphate-selective porin